jgi:hypothetical protein
MRGSTSMIFEGEKQLINLRIEVGIRINLTAFSERNPGGFRLRAGQICSPRSHFAAVAKELFDIRR